MFAPSVAPAERRPAAPREEIDGKGGGEKAIKTGRGEGGERERRGLPSEERKRKAPKRGNQPNPHSTRKWQQSAAMAAPHYFLHRLRGYRRHGHRLLQALSPPPPCIVANEGHATGSLPFIGRCCCCRLPHLPRTKVVGRRWSVGPMASEPNRGRRTTNRATFEFPPLDRPRPRRFRLRLLDRRRARWRRATRSTNRRRSGSPPAP